MEPLSPTTAALELSKQNSAVAVCNLKRLSLVDNERRDWTTTGIKDPEPRHCVTPTTPQALSWYTTDEATTTPTTETRENPLQSPFSYSDAATSAVVAIGSLNSTTMTTPLSVTLIPPRVCRLSEAEWQASLALYDMSKEVVDNEETNHHHTQNDNHCRLLGNENNGLAMSNQDQEGSAVQQTMLARANAATKTRSDPWTDQRCLIRQERRKKKQKKKRADMKLDGGAQTETGHTSAPTNNGRETRSVSPARAPKRKKRVASNHTESISSHDSTAKRSKRSCASPSKRDYTPVPSFLAEVDPYQHKEPAELPKEMIEGTAESTKTLGFNELCPNDVIMGRGHGISSFPGNQRFRQIIQHFRPAYTSSLRNEKQLVTRRVVDFVSECGGRFLEEVRGKDGSRTALKAARFHPVPLARAMEKIAQACREKVPTK